MSHLVRLCCALAALVLGLALYTNVVSSASNRPHGPDAGSNAASASAVAATAAASPTPSTAFISVNSLSDVAADDGLCTLREALTSANTQAASGAASGECVAGAAFNSVSLTVTGTITLTSALPAVNSDVNISGPGPRFLTVSGNNAYRVFDIAAGATLAISGLTVSEGRADSGAGFHNSGKLTVFACVISHNNAVSNASPLPGGTNFGGGVYNDSNATLDISNSTLSYNSTGAHFGDGGGGLFNRGTATLTNTTVSSNAADTGGGIGNSGPLLMLRSVTVANNTASYVAGGIQNLSNVSVSLDNTLLAGNTAGSSGPDCGGPYTSQDYNLIGNTGGCSFNGGTTHNIVNVDAGIGPLQDNGGLTPTHALLPGSPAIDKGNTTNTGLSGDQRSAPRPVNFVTVTDAAGGDGSDIGAFETGATELLMVNSLLDTNDNFCDTQNCTLREALNAANANSDHSAIYFSVAGTINLTGALPDITTGMTIKGPGSGLLTVRRNTGGSYRIFTLNSAATRLISGLTVTNGRTADGVAGDQPFNIGGHGGGILNAGTLTLTDVVVTGNRTGDGGAASGNPFGGFGGFGGGISSSGTLTLTNVTVSNNTTGHGGTGEYGGPGGLGGGIQATGTLSMTHCFVTGNSTGTGSVGTSGNGQGGSGGGIYAGDATNFNSAAINLTDTVVSGNRTADAGGPNIGGGSGGGILLEKGTGTLTNVAVTNNGTGSGTGFSGQGGFGGGVFNHSLATMTVTGSTISGNTTGTNGSNGGGVGGGVLNSGTLNMLDSTVSGNTTTGTGAAGAGLWNAGTTTLTNCTVAFNNAATTTFGGAGVHTFESPYVVNLRNTIVARNTLSGGPNGPDVAGTINSMGFNLVGKADSNSTGLADGVNGDKVGTIVSPVNPRLAALGDYGGTTQTHALLPGSLAINAGTSAGAPSTDQRGVGRVGAVDIGAFESRGFGAAPTAGTPQSTPIKTFFSTALSATVASAFGEPVSGGVLTFNAPASGASGTFSSTATVGIGPGGVATAPAFLANATAGVYNVTASTAGSSSATFALTNLKGDQTISFAPLQDRTFGDAPFGVSATGGGSVSPITFASQTSNTCSVSGGTVTVLGAGTCSVMASQKGDDNYNAATPVSQSFQIAKAATGTAVSTSANPSAFGQPVTFTATVTSASGAPSGPVRFKADGTDLGTATLNAGVATVATSGLAAGAHNVTADYGGDSNFNASGGAQPRRRVLPVLLHRGRGRGQSDGQRQAPRRHLGRVGGQLRDRRRKFAGRLRLLLHADRHRARPLRLYARPRHAALRGGRGGEELHSARRRRLLHRRA
jgi:CSLREA domain-containing protein